MSRLPDKTQPSAQSQQNVSARTPTSTTSPRRFTYQSRPLIPILIPPVEEEPQATSSSEIHLIHHDDRTLNPGERFVLVLLSSTTNDIRIIVAEVRTQTRLVFKEVVIAHSTGAKYSIPYATPFQPGPDWYGELREYDPRRQIPQQMFKFIDGRESEGDIVTEITAGDERLKHYLVGLLNIQIEDIRDWVVEEWGIERREEVTAEASVSQPSSRRSWQDIVGGFEYKRS